MLQSTLDRHRFKLSTELQPLLHRVSSVELLPWLSDGLHHAAAAVASAQQLDYLEHLQLSFHLDRLSSLPSLPAPNRLSVADATHEYQAAMVIAHQRALNVWEQATRCAGNDPYRSWTSAM